MNKRYFVLTLRIVFLSLILSSCIKPIAEFNQQAYDNAFDLKYDTLQLIDKAVDPYSQHKAEIEKINKKMHRVKEYSMWIPNNKFTTDQWELLIKPQSEDGKLYGNFLDLWKNYKIEGVESGLSPTYIKAVKKNIEFAFNMIICLEVNKKENNNCTEMAKKMKTTNQVSP